MYWDEDHQAVKFIILMSPSKVMNKGLSQVTDSSVDLIDNEADQAELLEEPSFERFKEKFIKNHTKQKEKSNMKEIMLVCNAGMSTSMLVTKMQKQAEAQGVDAKIWAVSLSEVDENIKKNNIEAILVGPQVKFIIKKLEAAYEPEIQVTDIPMADYGRMDGEKVLALALSPA